MYADKIESGEYVLLYSTYARDEILFNANFGETINWYETSGPGTSSKKLYFGSSSNMKSALSGVE